MISDDGTDSVPPSASAEEPAELTIEGLFSDEFGRLVALAALLMGDRGRAEDVVAEAFLRLDRHKGTVLRYDDPVGWLRLVVVRIAHKERRRQVMRSRARSVEIPTGSFEEEVVATESFLAAIRGLSRRQREVMSLAYVYDMSAVAIGEALGVSASTVRVTMKKARDRLRSDLDGVI